MELIITRKIVEEARYYLEDSFAGYNIYVHENANVSHVKKQSIDDKLCVLFGSYFGKEEDAVAYLYAGKKKYGDNYIVDGEGSYLYFEISKNGKIELWSEREGLIPVYYSTKSGNIEITTVGSRLFEDFEEKDLDISALYDYLHCGSIIGEHTFSKNVKLLQGGCKLDSDGLNKVDISRLYVFRHDSSQKISEDDLMDEISDTFNNAVKKRIDRNIKDVSVFLSGGMDSRFVLSAVNKYFDKDKIECVGFGQPFSEEVDVARKVAALKGNKFSYIDLKPENFIEKASQYSKMVMGSDMVIQSHIIDVSKKIKDMGYSAFLTGTVLECHIGGTYLHEKALTTDKKFSNFMEEESQKSLHFELFSNEEIKEFCEEDKYKQLFEQDGVRDNIKDEARFFDDYPVQDVIQSFVVNNRIKKTVLNREIVPSAELDYLNPNFDADFLKAVAKIPASRRMGREFYRDFYVKKLPEYADIVYNNTNIPISAPFSLWKKGMENEAGRERIFEELQKERKINYPHYYSDFNSYSRYNPSWKRFFDETLFSKNAYLVGNLIKKEAIQKMYDDHIAGVKNNRNKLANLASIELFLQNYMK